MDTTHPINPVDQETAHAATAPANEVTTEPHKQENDQERQRRLGSELFVFTNKKAGMADVDQQRVQQIVYDMSKDSLYFQNSLKQNANVDLRIQTMQSQLAQLSTGRRALLTKQIDQQILQLETRRDLTRTIVVVDMDMFYAAVEMRDNPALRDVPLAVGGLSMISTTNYLARQNGVRAAMPGFIGKKLCPELVFVPVDIPKYAAIAAEIREVFARYDPQFTAFSLDEACLDISEFMDAHWDEYSVKGSEAFSSTSSKCYAMTHGTQGCASEREQEEDEQEQEFDEQGKPERSMEQRLQVAAAVVQELRLKIFEKTRLTASAGIAANTMLAKICSDMNKPNGQFALPFTRSHVLSFVRSLSVRKIGGIGKVMEKILAALDVTNGEHLFTKRVELAHVFSAKTSLWLLQTALGIRATRGSEESERKSFSRERTFANEKDASKLEQICRRVCEMLAEDLEAADTRAKTITLKLKCADFTVKSRAVSLAASVQSSEELYTQAVELLRKEMPLTLRLLGVRASALVDGHHRNTGSPQKRKRQLAMQQFAKKDAWKCPFESSEEESATAQRMTRRRKTAPSNDLMRAFLVSGRANSAADEIVSGHEDSAGGLQPCPVCGDLLDASNNESVNTHLDACIQKTQPRQPKNTSSSSISSFFRPASQQ